MTISSRSDLTSMRRVGRVVAEALRAMEGEARPGISTAELDRIAAKTFRRHGARSAPAITYGFPGTTCISVNDEIVHGIPGPRRLVPGDLLKLDVTAELHGYVADAAITVLIPPATRDARRVRRCARGAFERAFGSARPGLRLSELGRTVEEEVVARGCSVLRELCGHGVGRTIHENPSVPNYFDHFATGRLTEGLVIALEPMVSARPARVIEDDDGWTLRTHNRALAAHHEHTIVITESGAEILTATAA